MKMEGQREREIGDGKRENDGEFVVVMCDMS